MNRVQFWQGNEACAEGAFYAGARFYAGYPITPSSEIAEAASRRLPQLGGVYMQMEDEIASLSAIIGASLSGVKSFTATSGPGFSLMQENLGFAIMGEVPCVIINVQRLGPSTGLATKVAQADIMQARWGTHGDHAIIALAPSTVQECFDLTVEAFNLSERFRTPVLILSDQIVGQMREKVLVRTPGELEIIDRRKPTGEFEAYLPYRFDGIGVPPMAAYGDPYILRVSSSMHGETGFTESDPRTASNVINYLYNKIYDHIDEITLSRSYGCEEAEVLIISYGATSRAAQAALIKAQGDGIRVGLLKLLSIWPFPEKLVIEYCQKVNAVLVPELNLGQIVREVKCVLKKDIPVYAYNKSNGRSISPQEIYQIIKEVSG